MMASHDSDFSYFGFFTIDHSRFAIHYFWGENNISTLVVLVNFREKEMREKFNEYISNSLTH
jgi:hypothetical protein